MNRVISTTILVAAALSAFAASALADTTTCTVTSDELRLRKSPSKHGRVVAILKKDARVTTVGACRGGWVKVASEDGRLSGYVGGWALFGEAPKVIASGPNQAKPEPVQAELVKPAAIAKPELAKAAVVAPVAARMEVPTNEHLAIQITQLRLNLLGLDRDMEVMKKEVAKIKASVVHLAQAKKPATRTAKAHKHLVKKG
jgi:hypothetical protein